MSILGISEMINAMRLAGALAIFLASNISSQVIHSGFHAQ